MSSDSLCLICVVNGITYERYAEQLFESAERHLRTAGNRPANVLMLPGRRGWPDATMYRYHVVVEHQDLIPEGFVFLSDADMLFEGDVGPEILPSPDFRQPGVTATLHPAYVARPRAELPYEDRPESSCYLGDAEGRTYYCGGFVGGTREGFLTLAKRVATLVDQDRDRGIIPRWHDESALNRVLAKYPPDRTLTPAYCHPDDDEWYRGRWPEDYPRLLVALDKTSEERAARDRRGIRRSPADAISHAFRRLRG